jgi:hypothetical protein
MLIKNPDIFSEFSDGQMIFIDMDKGVFYLLRHTGTWAAQNKFNGVDTASIVSAIKSVPLCPDDIDARLENMFAKMIEFGLVSDDGTAEHAQTLEISNRQSLYFQDDFFNCEVQFSNDVSEMLINDPVHDVSSLGWSPFK